jgi:thiol-disulfide isomerase/thioredoxin
MLPLLRTFPALPFVARRPVACSLLGLVLGCASTPRPETASNRHGKLSELSRVEGDVTLCSHRVPEPVCTRHHPELVAKFQRAGDWCKEHGVPESQCLECHPDLTFEPLPRLDAKADIAWIAKQGEDVPALEPHAVKGKITVFDFYADWCAACRKVDGHMYEKLASGDDTLAYRKLNIVDWDSPLARRYVRTVPSLPFLVVFGPDGKRATTLYGANLAALDAAIAEAARR